MKKTLLTCLLSFLTLSAFAQQWTLKTPMFTPRHAMGLVVLNNLIYAVGGSNNGTVLNTMEAYSPVTDMWTLKAPMTTSRVEMAVAAVNGKIYAIGGYNTGGALNTVEAYDPATNTWTAKSPMPTPRSQVCMCVINDKIYVVGGWSGQYPTLEVYDPATDTWTTKAPLTNGLMQNNGGVAYNSKFYVIGGKDYSGTTIYDSVHVYNPATNAWAVAANLPQASFSGAAALLNNKIHYFGGSPDNFANTHMYDAHYVYDPATNTWSNGLAMPEKRALHAAATVNGKIYVIGGLVEGNSNSSNINEEYSEPGLGVNTVAGNANLSVYPNPAADNVTIELAAGNSADKRVDITDLSGKIIAAYTFQGNKFVINTAGIAAGTYLLILNDGNTIAAEKLAIAH